MKFRPVYYMISGWPSLEKTREMVRRYVEHGVTALQFDMPGADPSRESAFIQQGMRHARALYGEDYDVFMDALRGIERKVITFGLSPKADVYAENIMHRGSSSEFDIYHRGNLFAHVTLHVPGIHNVRNALAATAAAIVLGVSPNAVKYGLAGFEGAGRRFDYKGKFQGADLYDDYAHHPSELRALLDAVDTLDYQRTIVVFQPHTYSRTAKLFNDFVEQLRRPTIGDLCCAREKHHRHFFCRSGRADPGREVLPDVCGDRGRAAPHCPPGRHYSDCGRRRRVPHRRAPPVPGGQ